MFDTTISTTLFFFDNLPIVVALGVDAKFHQRPQ